MIDYKNGKIYKLVGGGLTYYGSTCNELRIRLYQHKKKSNKCKSKLLFDSDDKIEIILVEKYPCNDKMELHQRERYYIENNECINKIIPTRTEKEYYETNKDKINEKRKEYYEVNKDKIKRYRDDNKDKIKDIMKQYGEKNRDILKDKKKLYYENNKDKFKHYNGEKITCDCGSVIRKGDISRHKQSNKHIQFIK